MAKLIQFNSERLLNEWYEKTDERLLILLRNLAMKFGGIRLTCLVRTKEENDLLTKVGAVKNSRHLLNNTTGKCEAADINPRRNYKDNEEGWRSRIKFYLDTHTTGIQTIIQTHGTAPHIHIEIDPIPGSHVEIV